MDTEETAQFVRRTLRICRYLGTSPYIWSDKNKRMEFGGRRSLRYFVFVAWLVMYITYESFVFARWVQVSYFDPNATTQGKMGVQYVAFSYSIPAMLHIGTFFNADQHHLLINQIIGYQRGPLGSKMSSTVHAKNLKSFIVLFNINLWNATYIAELPGTETLKPRRFGRFMKGVMCVGVAVVSLNTMSMFRRPNAPHLLTSLIPDVTTVPKWKLIPVAMFQCYIWCTQWSTIYFFCTFFMCHICTAQNALEILK